MLLLHVWQPTSRIEDTRKKGEGPGRFKAAPRVSTLLPFCRGVGRPTREAPSEVGAVGSREGGRAKISSVDAKEKSSVALRRFRRPT